MEAEVAGETVGPHSPGETPEPQSSGEAAGLHGGIDGDVERTLAWQCLDAVRTRVAPLTYQAFDLYVMKNRPANEVARLLGMDTGMVYVAKNRVLSKARLEYEKLQSEDDEHE